MLYLGQETKLPTTANFVLPTDADLSSRRSYPPPRSPTAISCSPLFASTHPSETLNQPEALSRTPSILLADMTPDEPGGNRRY